MSLYCTLPRGGGSYYHSSIHSSLPPSESESGSSPSSSSSTITSDSSKQGTISNNYLHSINPRYQHLQSIKTMFNNINSSQQQQQQRVTSTSSSHNENSTSEDNNSLINSNSYPPQSLPQYHQFNHQNQNHHHDYQDYQQQQKNGDVSLLSSLVNNSSIESPVTPGLSSPQGNQFNQLLGLSNGLSIYNNINDSNATGTQGNGIMNPNNHQYQSQYQQQQNQQQHQRQSLQLSLPRHPPEPPQRIYYGLTNFDDLKTIRRNSITSLFEDQPTPNFYGDEDSAYDSTSNESLRLTVKELSKRSNSKKYFTLPTKLGRKLRKSSCPEFNKDNTNRQNNQNIAGLTSSTPSPVSDCSPSPKLIFNGPTFPSPSVPSSSKAILLTSSSISSTSSPTSSIAPSSSSPSSSPPTSTSSSDVLVSSTVSPPSPSSLVTEMSSSSSLSFPQPLLHNHNVIDNQQSSSSTPTPINETINSLSPITSSPSANENVCHCCYLLGCHNNQSFHITQCNTAQHQHQQLPGRVNPSGVVGINANNISPSSGQPSTLETLWEEPSSGHETVRLTEEAIYAAMRELNISLPTKDSVNGQANRNGGNSSSWLRANFLKAFRRSSSKNRSSKLISSTNNNSNSNTSSSYSCYTENEKLEHHHDGGSTTPSTIGGSSRRGSLILNSDQNNYPSHHQQQQSSSCYSDEISSKRTSSGPSVASSLVSLPLSCSSSVPPTPPLTPLPSYHPYQHQQHQHQSQLQLQIHDNQQQPSSSSTLTASHAGTTTEDVIKELNRQLVEKDQLLQEVCMESINHLNTIESLNELVTQLKVEIDSLKNQLNAKYPENGIDKINPDFQYRSNQMQVNQLTNHNCA